jgi:hypothetical protein
MDQDELEKLYAPSRWSKRFTPPKKVLEFHAQFGLESNK